mmetsp:Transcript_58175/g.138507  ORF Transcript_58175/g.138507 Transcript_58175/m.138507 type:complete len:97 (-) Transcript_58175:1822-2112(-)
MLSESDEATGGRHSFSSPSISQWESLHQASQLLPSKHPFPNAQSQDGFLGSPTILRGPWERVRCLIPLPCVLSVCPSEEGSWLQLPQGASAETSLN